MNLDAATKGSPKSQTVAETDTIEFTFLKLPAGLRAFCEDLYEFCPDIVDQGVGTVEALESEIRRS